jgi:hypothetical protein
MDIIAPSDKVVARLGKKQINKTNHFQIGNSKYGL